MSSFKLNDNETEWITFANITDRTKERKKRMRNKRIEQLKQQIKLTLMRVGLTSNKENEKELMEELEHLEKTLMRIEKILNK